MGGALNTHIAGIYYEMTNCWGLGVRFAEALLQLEIPAHVMSPQDHRAPEQVSLYLPSGEDVPVGLL